MLFSLISILFLTLLGFYKAESQKKLSMDKIQKALFFLIIPFLLDVKSALAYPDSEISMSISQTNKCAEPLLLDADTLEVALLHKVDIRYIVSHTRPLLEKGEDMSFILIPLTQGLVEYWQKESSNIRAHLDLYTQDLELIIILLRLLQTHTQLSRDDRKTLRNVLAIGTSLLLDSTNLLESPTIANILILEELIDIVN